MSFFERFVNSEKYPKGKNEVLCCLCLPQKNIDACVQPPKNTQVVTNLRTGCNESVHKLLSSCVRTACSKLLK